MKRSTALFVLVFLSLYLSIAYADEAKGSDVKGTKEAQVQKAQSPQPEKKAVEPRQEGQPKRHGPKEELPTLIVFDLVPEKGVEKGVANLLTEIVLDEVNKSKRYKVIGQKDIDKMLFWETNKQLKNCTESSCMMQIAGAMGAEYYIEGSLGSVGNKYVIAMKFIETIGVNIKSRTTRTVDRNEDVLIKEIKEMVGEIMGLGGGEKGIQINEKAEVSEGSKKGISKIGMGITGAGLLLIGGGVYFGIKSEDAKKDLNRKYEDISNDYKRYSTTANIMYITGGLMTAGGIVWMILSGKGEEKSGFEVLPSGVRYTYKY
jgi:TolB-like protein